MLYKSVLLLFVLTVALWSGCSEKQVKDLLDEEFPVTEQVKMVKFDPFEIDEIKTPVEMVAFDSLVFFRNFSGDYFISVFDAGTGRFVRDIAPKGLGPDEFLFVSSLYKKRKGISFFDLNLHKLFYTEISKGQLDSLVYSSIPVPVDTAALFDPMWICPLGEHHYYATGLIENNRCALLDSAACVLKRFGHYPNEENIQRYSSIALGFAFQGLTVCNEKASRMVIADNVGVSIQFYDMENRHNPSLLCEYVFVTPQFKDETTNDSWGVTFLKDKNIIGALGVQSYQEHALILFSGTNISDENARSGNKLLVYSWDGKPEKCIELDRKCSLFAVDEKSGVAYFLCSDADYDYTVYTIDLSVVIN